MNENTLNVETGSVKLKSVFWLWIRFSLILFLVSCRGLYSHTNIYLREDKKNTFYLDSYHANQEFFLQDIEVCHLEELGGLLITSGRIVFDKEQIERELISAYTKKLDSESIETSNDYFFLNKDCTLNLREVKKKIKTTESHVKCERKAISSRLVIKSKSLKHFEGGGGLEVAEDMGTDNHLLDYYLYTALFCSDTLLYLDNHLYTTSISAERGEQLRYELPQTVIDSLVSLSLEEYFKRVSQ